MRGKVSYSDIGLFLVLIATTVATFCDNSFHYSLFIKITFFLIGIVSISGVLYCAKNNRILLMSYFLFNFMFNFLAPIEQLEYGMFPFRTVINYGDVVTVNIMILCSFLIVVICTCKKSRIPKKKKVQLSHKALNISTKYLILLSCISCIICAYYISTFGFSNLIFRSTATALYSSSTLFLIQGTILPATMAFTTELAVLKFKSHKTVGTLLIMILNMVLLFLTFSPMSLARFKVATIYGTLLLTLFPKLRKGSNLAILLLLGLLYVFPIMSVFRNANANNVFELLASAWSSVQDNFISGDYDSYSSLAISIEHCRVNGYSYGKQLLGVLFFFIPRSIWPNKPIGTGAYMAQLKNADDFSNVSCQLMGEGYVNFGFIGAMVFIYFFIDILCKMERMYKLKANDSAKVNIYVLHMFFLIIFIMRGDLLASFSFVVGLLLIIKLLLKGAEKIH